LLARNIDVVDPFDLAIEENVFRMAKRVCVVFTVVAVTLSTLDLMNIRAVEHAAVFIHAHRYRIADLPRLIRSSISSIAVAASAPMVTVQIPRDDIAIAIAPDPVPTPTLAPAKSANSAIVELAAARY